MYPACDEFYQTSLLVITLENLHVGDVSNLSYICDASNKGWDEGLSLWPGLLYMTILSIAMYKPGNEARVVYTKSEEVGHKKNQILGVG